MEEKPYKWFLQELNNIHASLKILETGLCRGSKVIGWYSNSISDSIISKSVKTVNKTKYLINYFLNQRVPILEEYAPEKLICYLYHKNGKKLVNAKEAIELAENQLHGLQVTSIHMAMISIPEVYSVSAVNVGGELNTDVSLSKFGKTCSQPVRDSALIEKIINLLVTMSQYLNKITKQELKKLHIDFIFDTSGIIHIIKVTHLALKTFESNPVYLRKSSIKLVKHESSSEDSLDPEEVFKNPMKKVINLMMEKEKDKKNHLKVSISKPMLLNDEYFLQMIANTFDRDRKKYDFNEVIGRKSVYTSETKTSNLKNFQIKTRKSFRESSLLKKSLKNINDLLFYVEKTRPRIWLKDTKDMHIPKINSISALKKPSHSTQASTQILTPSLKNHNLDALLAEENRIGRKITLRSQAGKRKFGD
jgi:hypothetical protein